MEQKKMKLGKKAIKETVFFRFDVTKKCSIGEPKVQNKSVDKLLQDEAIIIIKTRPKFKLGTQTGKTVGV